MRELALDGTAVGGALLHACASSDEPIVVIGGPDSAMRVLWANRAFADSVKAEVVDLADVDVAKVLRTASGDLPLNSFRSSQFRVTLVPQVGAASTWVATAHPSPGTDDRSWVVMMRRAAEGVDLDELLRASEERFRILSERAPIGIFSSEVGLRFGYVNDWFAHLVGVPAEQLLGTGWIAWVDPADVDAVCAGLQDTLMGEPFEGPARLTTATGEQRWVTFRAVPVHSPDAPASFLGTVEDVTDRRRVEELLSFQATHDPLTGLPNRSQLTGEIDAVLATGATDVAVLFLDLDDFKMVNDSLGHAAGDELLVEVASRLRGAVREGDRVYRFAGDEFVVMARGANSDYEALGIANRLRSKVAEPVKLLDEEFQVRCSAGVVRADAHASAESLLRDADTAMYQAKRHRKGSAALFDPAVRGQLDEDLDFQERVRDAIASDAVTITYSPVMALSSPGIAVALDASLTMVDRDGTEVDAATIIRIARQAKLIRQLALGSIDKVCADLAAWRSDGPSADAVGGAPLWLSVTMSRGDLLVPGLVDHLARALVRNRLVGSDIAVRVMPGSTPSGHSADGVIAQLAEMGVRLSLEDHVPSLATMLDLAEPSLTSLTMDVPRLLEGRRGEAVARALVALADQIQLDVVAAGLDDTAAVERAADLGFRLGTGAAFGPAVIAAAVPSIFAPVARP